MSNVLAFKPKITPELIGEYRAACDEARKANAFLRLMPSMLEALLDRAELSYADQEENPKLRKEIDELRAAAGMEPGWIAYGWSRVAESGNKLTVHYYESHGKPMFAWYLHPRGGGDVPVSGDAPTLVEAQKAIEEAERTLPQELKDEAERNRLKKIAELKKSIAELEGRS